MQCPRCNHPDFVATGTCPRCGFHGDRDQIEELSRLEWLLGEMDTWIDSGILKSTPKRLQKFYISRRQNIQIALGLYFPPFGLSEVRQAWAEFRKHELLFEEIEKWQAAGYIKRGYLPTYYARLIELRARLSEYRGPEYPETDQERLENVEFLLEAAQQLEALDKFSTADDKLSVTTPLWIEKARLENILNPPVEIKPEPALVGLEAVPVSDVISSPFPTPSTETVVPAPRIPQPSFRERLWRSILSERTLQALLFLATALSVTQDSNPLFFMAGLSL